MIKSNLEEISEEEKVGFMAKVILEKMKEGKRYEDRFILIEQNSKGEIIIKEKDYLTKGGGNKTKTVFIGNKAQTKKYEPSEQWKSYIANLFYYDLPQLQKDIKEWFSQ